MPDKPTKPHRVSEHTAITEEMLGIKPSAAAMRAAFALHPEEAKKLSPDFPWAGFIGREQKILIIQGLQSDFEQKARIIDAEFTPLVEALENFATHCPYSSP